MARPASLAQESAAARVAPPREAAATPRQPRRSTTPTRIIAIKTAIWIAALIPFGCLIVGALQVLGYVDMQWYPHGLTANPIDRITDFTGDWAIAFLVISLGVTPLRRITGLNDAIKFRRLLGLFAFFYALLHLLTWVVLDKFFDFAWMGRDVLERPFITIGMATFVILLA